MTNSANLIPQAHVLSVEEQSKGGVASGQSRRNRKRLRECIEMALEGSYYSLEGKEMTRAEGIAIAMCQKALDGDVAAAKFIRDTCDGLPVQRIEQEPIISPETYERVARFLDGDM